MDSATEDDVYLFIFLPNGIFIVILYASPKISRFVTIIERIITIVSSNVAQILFIFRPFGFVEINFWSIVSATSYQQKYSIEIGVPPILLNTNLKNKISRYGSHWNPLIYYKNLGFNNCFNSLLTFTLTMKHKSWLSKFCYSNYK